MTEKPGQTPRYSREWFQSVNLSSSTEAIALTEHMSRSAEIVLGRLYNAKVWKHIMGYQTTMLSLRPEKIDRGKASPFVKEVIRSTRSLDIDGNDPRFRYLVTMLFLTVEEQRRQVPSSILTLDQLEKFRARTTDSAKKDELLEIGRKQARKERLRKKQEASRRKTKLRNYAYQHEISDEDRKGLNESVTGIIHRSRI